MIAYTEVGNYLPMTERNDTHSREESVTRAPVTAPGTRCTCTVGALKIIPLAAISYCHLNKQGKLDTRLFGAIIFFYAEQKTADYHQ